VGEFGLTVTLEGILVSLLGKTKRIEESNGSEGSWKFLGGLLMISWCESMAFKDMSRRGHFLRARVAVVVSLLGTRTVTTYHTEGGGRRSHLRRGKGSGRSDKGGEGGEKLHGQLVKGCVRVLDN